MSRRCGPLYYGSGSSLLFALLRALSAEVAAQLRELGGLMQAIAESGVDASAAPLTFQSRSCKQQGIWLAIVPYLCCCVTQVRALRRAAAKAPLRRRGARDLRRVGEPANAAPSKVSRASV